MEPARLRSPLLAAAALAGAALLLAPARPGTAFTLLGFSLPVAQRDVRVFNNFQDPSANDNTTPDASFPGATGAPLAIWKGIVEWGSELHGDGGGDPSQPFDLGSGGANFDATWQGLAAGPGGLDDNVFSALASCGGGVSSFIEAPDASGFRVRFCEDLLWDDGPGTALTPGALDLQGLATRSYGFALGLGHSAAVGATMTPVLLDDGVSLRSIEADDVAGIQAIYGPRAAAKPRITGIVGNGDGTLSVTGENFAPFGNEVWFTRGTPGGDGTPVTVAGLASGAGGTSLTVAVPPDAGPGDVLVRSGSGGSGASLSNAWPTDAKACVASRAASETVRLGSPPNPDALRPGASRGPVIGEVWDPWVDHGSFFPSAGVDVLGIGLVPANQPSPIGTLLCDIGALPFVFSGAAGLPFSVPIPANCGLVGAPLCSQAGSTDGASIQLTNALDVVVGTF